MQYIHNPKCSKSQQGLKYLKEKNIPVTIINYLHTPLNTQTLENLYNITKNDPNTLIRQKDAQQQAVHATTKKDILKAIQQNPELLERPILITSQNTAIIGRPHERFRKFVDELNA